MSEEQAAPRTAGGAEGLGNQGENGSTAADQAADGTDLERELDELRSRAQTYLDLAQRTQADFVNYKRRTEQERSDYARASRGDIIVKLLGPIDDLERALGALPDDVRNTSWAQGIELVERKFVQTLESLGVKRVDPVGQPFDPREEEAIGQEPSARYPEGVVARVVQSGYRIDGRALRPALVVVSSGRQGAG